MGKIITVDFRSDTLFAAERDDGVFVAVTPICQALGLNANKQRERIQNDQILREGGTVTVFPSAGGMQETYCLRLDLVNGWLFTIDESRIKDPAVRERVLTYKRECYGVLFQHFYGKHERHERPADLIEPPTATEEPEGPKVRLVTEARHTFGPQAAGQLWFKLGLPVVPAMYHDPRQGELLRYDQIKTSEAPEAEAA